jgi:prevent-host-death family protein
MSEPLAAASTVSLYEAKTHLSELGERAARGEEIIVTKHGKPRFKLIAVLDRSARPLPGTLDLGLTRAQAAALAAVDWFAPDEEIERDFGMRE